MPKTLDRARRPAVVWPSSERRKFAGRRQDGLLDVHVRGVGISHRIQVRLDGDLLSQLRRFAEESGLGLSPALRLLAARSLRAAGREEGGSPAVGERASLAALLAAEHALLLTASVLPEGERRMAALAERAASAAEERLALFSDQARAEGSRE